VGLQGTNCLRGTTKAGDDDDDDDDDAVWMAAVMCGRRNGGGGWRVNVGVRAAQRSTSTYSGTQLDRREGRRDWSPVATESIHKPSKLQCKRCGESGRRELLPYSIGPSKPFRWSS